MQLSDINQDQFAGQGLSLVPDLKYISAIKIAQNAHYYTVKKSLLP